MRYACCSLVRSCHLGLVVLTALCAGRARAAVIFGQLDDFQDGTTQGWVEGAPTTNEPANAAGGRGGAADRYLRNVASGSFGPGGKQIVFNQAQWAGDYNAAGVTRITGWFANFGATPLFIRVAFEGAFTRFSSADAFALPADGVWRRASFDLADMTHISGPATLSGALSGVRDMRLLSSAFPAYVGESVASTLGIDDLRALRSEGDANFDGRVDGTDLRLVRSNLGSQDVSWDDGDFNFDGRVNARDVALLRRNYGLSVAAPAAAVSVVPEPAAAFLLALLPLALLLRRRPVPIDPAEVVDASGGG